MLSIETKTKELQRWCIDRSWNHSWHWALGVDLGMESTFTLPGYLFSYVCPHFAIHVSFLSPLTLSHDGH
jgi:hypothetical protein